MTKCLLRDEFPCDQTHNHDVLERKFDSFQEALDFVKDIGLDEGFKIDHTNKGVAYKHYRCSRHGLPRGKKTKKGLVCHAKFSITTNKAGVAYLQGCIKHRVAIQWHKYH